MTTTSAVAGPRVLKGGRSGLPGRRGPGGAKDQVMITRVGLSFPPLLTFEDWQRAGMQVGRVLDSSAWCLGDWVLYGQLNYKDRYQRAVEAAGLDYQTIRNYVWVARCFDVSRRRDRLSFQHHAEVASMEHDDQERWLSRAEEQGWSRNQLRREIRAARDGATTTGQKQSPVKISPGEGRVDLWRAAAEKANVTLHEWIVGRLDSAATSDLV